MSHWKHLWDLPGRVAFFIVKIPWNRLLEKKKIIIFKRISRYYFFIMWFSVASQDFWQCRDKWFEPLEGAQGIALFQSTFGSQDTVHATSFWVNPASLIICSLNLQKNQLQYFQMWEIKALLISTSPLDASEAFGVAGSQPLCPVFQGKQRGCQALPVVLCAPKGSSLPWCSFCPDSPWQEIWVQRLCHKVSENCQSCAFGYLGAEGERKGEDRVPLPAGR